MQRRIAVVAVAVLAALVFELLGATHAEATLASRCRRYCASAIRQCFYYGERRPRCRRRYVRLCKRSGFTACDLTPVTTTTLPFVPATTTTFTTTTTTYRPPTTTTLPSRLSLLLGRWAFTYTIVSTFTDHYSLTVVEPAPNGDPYNVVQGYNIDYGNTVVAASVQDLNPGDTTGYEFAMLDPESSSLCEFFDFNVAGASSATGVVLFFYGDCQTPISGNLYRFTGTKY